MIIVTVRLRLPTWTQAWSRLSRPCPISSQSQWNFFSEAEGLIWLRGPSFPFKIFWSETGMVGGHTSYFLWHFYTLFEGFSLINALTRLVHIQDWRLKTGDWSLGSGRRLIFAVTSWETLGIIFAGSSLACEHISSTASLIFKLNPDVQGLSFSLLAVSSKTWCVMTVDTEWQLSQIFWVLLPDFKILYDYNHLLELIHKYFLSCHLYVE